MCDMAMYSIYAIIEKRNIGCIHNLNFCGGFSDCSVLRFLKDKAIADTLPQYKYNII